MQTTLTFNGFRKRSGEVVGFDPSKIETAVNLAARAAAREYPDLEPCEPGAMIAERVLAQLQDSRSDYFVQEDADGLRVPEIEDVQDLVEIQLAEAGLMQVFTVYKRYRKQRDSTRARIRVRETAPDGRQNVTDASLLLVESGSSGMTLPWDRQRIVRHILAHTPVELDTACAVAKAVENRIIDSRMSMLNTSLIREMVNNELSSRGLGAQLRDLSLYRVPRDYVDAMMNTKSEENSNIVNNNPEAVNLGIAELVLKQWALDTIFSESVRRAHNTGAIHLHDLGYPHRVYCSSHSLEYVKKYGLQGLVNLNTESHPARSASVLTGHLNTFLASMQANYAGALGIAYVNILYAPLLSGMGPKEMKQVAQELIFNGSQNAFSRGGQTLFLDFNIHSGVPSYLKKVPSIGKGGHYEFRTSGNEILPLRELLREELDPSGYPLMDLLLGDRLVLREINTPAGVRFDPAVEATLAEGEKVLTYGDFEEEARAFCLALLEVWGDGDRNGRVFEFPKCDFHVHEDTFRDPGEQKVFEAACELAAKNGSTYFIFDRDEVTLSACCRLRTTIDDDRMLRHPENMRFCGFQNVTLNLPQAAFRAKRSAAEGEDLFACFLREIEATMDLAVEAHLQKKAFSQTLMQGPGQPLWQIGKPSCDGKPYVTLDTCTYILGLIGLNDAVRFLTGRELHDDPAVQRQGLRVIAHMYRKTKKLGEKYGLKFTLEESPAESAARRLAKTDLVHYRGEALQVIKGGDEDVCYYTNSVHLTADAPVGLVTRIREQAKYHCMIESGAITHAFIGEEQPSPAAIARLVTDTFHRTQTAQLTISPEFTYCNHCNHACRGLQEQCPSCGSEEVVGETRVVGYFSKIQNWNKSKRYGELKARQAGQYRIEA